MSGLSSPAKKIAELVGYAPIDGYRLEVFYWVDKILKPVTARGVPPSPDGLAKITEDGITKPVYQMAVFRETDRRSPDGAVIFEYSPNEEWSNERC